jgi:hypothetical protein
MADEAKYKGFNISIRPEGNGWTATIAKCDGGLLLLDLPGSSKKDRKEWIDTPRQDSAIEAMKLALDTIDAGGVL